MSESNTIAESGGADYTPEELGGASPPGADSAPPPSTTPDPEPGGDAAPEGDSAGPQLGEGESGPELDAQGRPRLVPHQAMHQERLLRQQAEDRARALEAQVRTIEQRQAMVQEYLLRQAQGGQPQAPQGPQEPQIPDVETDPIGHFRARNELLERRLAELAQPIQQQQQMTQFQAAVRQQVDAFERRTPDYAAAYAFAREQWQADAQAYQDDPQAAEMMIAQRALQQGKNVGEAVYEFALRKGWRPSSGAPAAAGGAVGGAAAPARQAPDLGALQRGQQASRSVGAAGQPAGRGQITPEVLGTWKAKDIGNLSEAEFRKIMGGGG